MDERAWEAGYRYLRGMVADDPAPPLDPPADWAERVDALRLLALALADAVEGARGARRRLLQVALARLVTLGVEARAHARRI